MIKVARAQMQVQKLAQNTDKLTCKPRYSDITEKGKQRVQEKTDEIECFNCQGTCDYQKLCRFLSRILMGTRLLP